MRGSSISTFILYYCWLVDTSKPGFTQTDQDELEETISSGKVNALSIAFPISESSLKALNDALPNAFAVNNLSRK